MTTYTLLYSLPTAWLVCALLALGLEFVSGTLYLLVFSIALAGGGFAALAGLALPLQFVAASACGLAALAGVTRWKRRAAPPAPVADPDIGQTVLILKPTGPDTVRVHFRGTEWDARLLDGPPVPGAHARIVGRDGNLLHIVSIK